MKKDNRWPQEQTGSPAVLGFRVLYTRQTSRDPGLACYLCAPRSRHFDTPSPANNPHRTTTETRPSNPKSGCLRLFSQWEREMACPHGDGAFCSNVSQFWLNSRAPLCHLC